MSLDANAIRRHLGDAVERLESLEVFPEIDSTNSHLMHQPAPLEGHTRVAVTENQTAGRGRHGRRWQSPPGTGLCLSLAYTFAEKPDNLPALTLATGLGVVNALEEHRVTGVQLKWPNDLIAGNSKLGGILTEAHAQPQSGSALTVVTGIGLNVNLSQHPDLLAEDARAQRIIGLSELVGVMPDTNSLVSSLVGGLTGVMLNYGARGFAQFREQWLKLDWLHGRSVVIETPRQALAGVGAGIADNGALKVATAGSGIQHVTSGTVKLAGQGDAIL